MGTAVKKFFYCDMCPATFDNGQALRDVALPARLYNEEGTDYVRGYQKASLCQTCLNKFWEASDTYFARVEVGLRGVKFYPVDQEQDLPEREPAIVGFLDKIQVDK